MGKKLWVKMFGGFSAWYGDEVLSFGRQNDPKFGQLFQILMTRPGQGFSKRDIARSLYGREEVEDQNASLNNTIFRLRRYLKASPLPDGDHLLLNDGVLRFDSKIKVESDVWSFEKAAREFEKEEDEQKKAKISKRACDLYQGEFLPQLSNEQWVIEKSRDYGMLYSRLLRYLLRYLEKEGEYKSMEALSSRAAKFHPCEGWESWQIESLIALGRHKEAEAVYQETAAYVQEIGGFLSKSGQTKLHRIGEQMRQPKGTADDIRRCLLETVQTEGAYSCTLPGFCDCLRMLKRVFDRQKAVSFSLFLCTILDAGGRPADEREYCKKQGERLQKTFQSYLRRGDIYARYSENQYLLLCMGAERTDIPKIGIRLDMDLRKRSGGRGGLSCRLLDDGSEW